MSVKYFIVGVMLLLPLGCGMDTKKSDDNKGKSPNAPQLDFDADINPILQNKCTPCHAPGARHTNFVGDEAVFEEHGDHVLSHIETTDQQKIMPPPGNGRTPLTAEEKQKIRSYLEQED